MKRINEHPVLGTSEQTPIQFEFDGQKYQALQGDSIASALLASGIRTLRYSNREGQPRGLYCGIGHCYECRLTVNGTPSIRACITPTCDGDVIASQGQPGKEGQPDEV